LNELLERTGLATDLELFRILDNPVKMNTVALAWKLKGNDSVESVGTLPKHFDGPLGGAGALI
jgi:hypothetical protein